MKRYKCLIREFQFLETEYHFAICSIQKSGSYYFVVWTNSKINIKVLYDETQENHVSILVYDAASLGTYADVVEYQVEFSGSTLKPIIQIEQASIWLRKAIAESIIKIK